MYRQRFWERTLDRPKTSLTFAYTIWKLLLVSVAILSPGPGYDTSTTLLYPNEDASKIVSWPESVVESWLQHLVRWDAIYFTQIARRGYEWEQEWAFNWGFAKLMSSVGRSKYSINRIHIGIQDIY